MSSIAEWFWRGEGSSPEHTNRSTVFGNRLPRVDKAGKPKSRDGGIRVGPVSVCQDRGE